MKMINSNCWLIVFTFLYSCNGTQMKREDIPQSAPEINNQYYTDSCEVHLLKFPGADSIRFCYLNVSAPYELGSMQVTVWKTGKKVLNDQCVDEIDGFFTFLSGQYFCYAVRKKSIFVFEIKIGDKVDCLNEQFYDVGANQCTEFYTVNSGILSKDSLLYIQATVNNVCFDQASDTTIVYNLIR